MRIKKAIWFTCMFLGSWWIAPVSKALTPPAPLSPRHLLQGAVGPRVGERRKGTPTQRGELAQPSGFQYWVKGEQDEDFKNAGSSLSAQTLPVLSPQNWDAGGANTAFTTISQIPVSAIAPQDNIQAVLGVSITVSDMDEALAFYTQVLPFKKISDIEVAGADYEQLQGLFGLRMRVVQLQLGREVIELIDYLTPGGRSMPVDSRSNDLWFQHIAIVVRDMDAAYQHLRKHNVQHASTGPQKLPDYIPAAAGIEAFYFRDPDGHNLEIIYFPPDKGDPRWQEPTNDLFLGIDHTAIAISNTPTSQNFYETLLGLKLAGQSENYGPEQERLNNVFGARLLISGLKAPTGPGIEFLEYLAPAGGRPYPTNSKSDDLWHWQTTIQVQNLEQAAIRLREQGADFISPGVVTLKSNSLGFRKGILLKDPDGHVLRIVER